MADVDSLIADARGFAASSFANSQSLVNNAVSTINGLSSRFVVQGPTFGSVNRPDIPQDIPEFSAPDFTLPPAPEGVTGLLVPDLTIDRPPENTAVKPAFIEPQKPAQLHELNLVAPVINTNLDFPTVPDALTNINIPMPTLDEHTIPTAPQLQIPTFGAQKPNDNISAPTDFEAKMANAYSSMAPSMRAALDGQMDTLMSRYNPRFKEQMAALEERIATYVAGGTALTPAVENAIYERTRDKVSAEAKRARDAAYSDAAKRGFSMPNGTLATLVNQARQAGADNNARAAIDIAVKQAELEQQNMQFALSLSTQLRSTVMSASLSYHSNLISLNGQALSYAQAILGAAVEVYNTLIKAFSAKLEAYKAEASVYETQLKGVLAQVDIYRAQISAFTALTEADSAKVGVYRARIEALDALGRVYQSQISAVLGKASLEKMKVELFGQQVQAYGAEAQAKSSEWQGYSAAINGQQARQQAYGEEIRAYATQIEAYKAVVQAKTAEVQVKLSYNESLLRQYASSVEGYKAIVGATSQIASTKLENDRLLLYAFQAKMSAAEAQARSTLSYYQTKANIASEGTKVVLQAAVESSRINTEQIKAVADTSISGARVYEGLASAALGGMNTLVSASS